MDIIKGILCLFIFIGALLGALWPILYDGEVNWLFDMDIKGGVQIVYQADFSTLPPEEQTPDAKRRLMEQSHIRLRSRLTNFQGADVRVQILGEDKLLVEVPGVRNIAKVKADLGEQKVVYFAHVTSFSLTEDSVRTIYSNNLWLETKKPVIFGGNILYNQIKIIQDGARYLVSIPLDSKGQSKMAELTTDIRDNPAYSTEPTTFPKKSEEIPLLALFLDQECQDIFRVQDRGIKEGVITSRTLAEAEILKMFLSSGPLPVKFNTYSERSISPLIGSVLQEKGFLAIMISLILLVLFMGASYIQRPWFLFVYIITLLFWFLCLMTLANFHVFRISLPLFAGFILLLGMNTDALVLIFEDLREGFKHGSLFRMDLVGKAFSVEWWVIFWGMMTTVTIILPLYLQEGDFFDDYISLLLWGMGINLLGFIFARLLMSLNISEELSIIKIDINNLADAFSKIDFTRFKYRRLGIAVIIIAALAVFVYPQIPVSTTFGGGKALEVEFSRPVPVATLTQGITNSIGFRAEIMTEESEGMTKWALVKFPAGIKLNSSTLLAEIESSTGAKPELISVNSISHALALKEIFQITAATFIGLLLLLFLSVYIYNMLSGILIMVALFHDILICLGVMAIFQIPLDFFAIAALFTMAGYSINDSIVILHKLKALKSDKFGNADLSDDELEWVRVNNLRRLSARVIITSVSTALPMVIIALVAGEALRHYSVIIFAGIFFGTLSSLYIVGTIKPAGFIRW
jgi:SecD/SecF fusion protein